MLNILIGDDHAVFRRGTQELLNEHFAPLAIGEADTGSQMISLAEQGDWDVCIMDITMPGRSGTELLQELLRARPSTPVLALTMHPEKSYAVRMIRSGASGYLNKSTTNSHQLANAIKAVLSGHKFITPEVAECLAETVQASSSKSPHELLSNREFQILRLLAVGKPVKEIAGELYVSPATISTYRSRVLDKLGLKSNAELVRYAIKLSLID